MIRLSNLLFGGKHQVVRKGLEQFGVTSHYGFLSTSSINGQVGVSTTFDPSLIGLPAMRCQRYTQVVPPLIHRNNHPRIMVTGALGQIGSELCARLRHMYGVDNVLASDVRKASGLLGVSGPFVHADVSRYTTLERLVVEHDIDWVVHLSGILSARGEKYPEMALKVNVDGVRNVIHLARKHKLRVFAPSSIAVFGKETPKENTPDTTIMRPTTMYGTTKVLLELLGDYYHNSYGVDFRSLRYPGIISSETLPGGGTTDYAVEVFHEAIQSKKYTCWLKEDAKLPMMFMDDCLDATVSLLQADSSNLKQRTYNVTGLSFTPAELFAEIKKHIPDFEVDYKVDPIRQKIAESWPDSLNDQCARNDWNWKPKYGLEKIVRVMLQRLQGNKNHDVK